MLVTITLSCIVDNVRALCKACFVSITKRFLHNAMISGFIILSLFISFHGIVEFQHSSRRTFWRTACDSISPCHFYPLITLSSRARARTENSITSRVETTIHVHCGNNTCPTTGHKVRYLSNKL